MKFELLYPIFLLCLEYIDDNYWKIIYEDLSYGKCPYGIYIKNNYLCCNFKNKKFNYKIQEDKDTKQFYYETYDILKNKFGLSSKNDKIDNKIAFEISESQIFKDTCCDWSSIKRKNIRLLFVEKYIIEKCKNYNIDIKNQIKLLNIIFLGLHLKTITKNHIIFDNFKIKDITCITFENGIYHVNIDIFDFKQKFIFI